LTGEDRVIIAIRNYNDEVFSTGRPNYGLVTKLTPLLKDIGWVTGRDVSNTVAETFKPSPWIAVWINRPCENGGAVLSNGKIDILNKQGERGTDIPAFVVNRDYFVDTYKLIEYLTLHGCNRVEDPLWDVSAAPRPKRNGLVKAIN
jgi:hypothetical protein